MATSSARGVDTDNKAEVAEFILNDQSYGINGSKIKEIILHDEAKVSKPPFNHPSVVGVYLFRGNTVPLIDLRAYLELDQTGDLSRQVVVVTEFNEMTTAFMTDRVNRIHRLSWSDLTPMDPFLVKFSPQILGTVRRDDREILVLDLEQIIGEIFPQSVSSYGTEEFEHLEDADRRHAATVFFAEDSFVIRTQLQKVYETVGYKNVIAFEHGRAALDAILELKAECDRTGTALKDRLNLLISDIEMPQMDGLTLCRTLKKDYQLDFPVIMFSSLINDQIAAKCRAAGADDVVSKPQTELLIELMDRFCLEG